MIGIALTFVVLILAGVAPGRAVAQARLVCVHVWHSPRGTEDRGFHERQTEMDKSFLP